MLYQFQLSRCADAFEVAETAVDKLIKRVEAQMMIQDIYSQFQEAFAISTYFQQLNTAVALKALAQDKGEAFESVREKIQHEWDDGQETVRFPSHL